MNESLSNRWALVILLALLLLRQASSGIDVLSIGMLVPLSVALIPVLDSLQGCGSIRVWNRSQFVFQPLVRSEAPRMYWLSLIVYWPASLFFSYATVMVPPR